MPLLLQELASTHTELLAANLTSFLGVLHIARLARTCHAAHEMMFHDEAWRVHVLRCCWAHLRPSEQPMFGEELARMWMAAGLPMCWRDLFFAASSLNQYRQTWISNGSIKLSVHEERHFVEQQGVEMEQQEVEFDLRVMLAVTGAQLRVIPMSQDGLFRDWDVTHSADLRKGYPGYTNGVHVLDCRVDANFVVDDPCAFSVPYSQNETVRFRAETAEQAAALVEKINVTSYFRHEDMGHPDHESIAADMELFDQEGWGGNDGPSQARLVDAAEAFGIEFGRPQFFDGPVNSSS